MPEEATPPQEDAQAPEAPQEGTPSESTEDFRGRYEELRPQYDKTQNELSRWKQFGDPEEVANELQIIRALNSEDPELQKAAYEAIGVAYQEPEQPDEYQALQQNVAQLQEAFTAEQEQRQLEAQRQAEIDYLDEQLTELETAEGIQFTEAEMKLLVAAANHQRGEDGMPDVASAYKLLSEVDQPRQERRVKAKKTAQVKPGKQGEPVLDFSNRQSRVEQIAARMESE